VWGDGTKLANLLTRARTLEESFAAKAESIMLDLPVRIDEATVLRAITAEGGTLRMTYDIEVKISDFDEGLEHHLAAENCGSETFGIDIARGGRILFVYLGRMV
jgi:hypothetical protein